MAEVLKYHRNPKDKIAAIARPEVAEELGLGRDGARALYPIVVASFVIQGLRSDGLPIAIVEAKGYQEFERLVRGEFSDSHLEAFEIREAFDLVCREGRRPGAPMHFTIDTADKMRLLHAVQKDYAAAIDANRVH